MCCDIVNHLGRDCVKQRRLHEPCADASDNSLDRLPGLVSEIFVGGDLLVPRVDKVVENMVEDCVQYFVNILVSCELFLLPS